MANVKRMIVGAILFTVAFKLSSELLEDSAAGDWVNLALYIGFAGFMLSQIVFSVQQLENNSSSAYE
jgi:hypothetical protein